MESFRHNAKTIAPFSDRFFYTKIAKMVFLHNQKSDMRSLRCHKGKQKSSSCQQEKWMNLFKLIILFFLLYMPLRRWNPDRKQSFPAAALTGGAGWVWCCLHFPEKEKCTSLLVLFFFFFFLPNSDLSCDERESSFHLKKTEAETGCKECLMPGWELSETLEMRPLDLGQSFFCFVSDIILPSLQWQRHMVCNGKSSGGGLCSLGHLIGENQTNPNQRKSKPKKAQRNK